MIEALRDLGDWSFDSDAIIDYNDIITPNRVFGFAMSSITIRNLDRSVKERLRVRAAEHGRSMEAEARRILQTALSNRGAPPTRDLYHRIHARFAKLGGVNVVAPPRDVAREPPGFD